MHESFTMNCIGAILLRAISGSCAISKCARERLRDCATGDGFSKRSGFIFGLDFVSRRMTLIVEILTRRKIDGSIAWNDLILKTASDKNTP
jgi:hypothetical protein